MDFGRWVSVVWRNGVDGSIALGVGFCRGHLADRMDGVEVGGAKSVVDGSVDSGVDGGAVCIGAADHVGYESDLLGDDGIGLFGRGGHGKSESVGGLPFLFMYGLGIFGQRADGLGCSAFGRSCLGWSGQKERGKVKSSLGMGDSHDGGGSTELVCGGVFEISGVMELFCGVRIGGEICQHNARQIKTVVVFSANSADWDGAVDRIFAGFDSAVLSQDEGEEVVPGLLGGWGGDRDSVCRGEL